MDNIVYMFGIALLEHDGYCDFMDDSTQYKVVKWKLSDMNKYIGNAGKSDLYEDIEILTANDCMEEFMFLGLRLTKGIELQTFEHQFGKSFWDVYQDAADKLFSEQLLCLDESKKNLRLTDYGVDVSNYALAEFLLDY